MLARGENGGPFVEATPVVLAGLGAALGLVIGVRLAAKVAESTLPEICQPALRTVT